MRLGWLWAALLGFLLSTCPVFAKSFRWANDVDVFSLDPYARQETFLLSFVSDIYEPLVRRGRDLRLEPALATSWIETSPDIWHFSLRAGVRFQDGAPFTADDVIYSFARARGPGSNLAGALASVRELRKLDDHAIEFLTHGPDPLLPEKLASWDIMSKAWCEEHDAAQPADATKGEENYASSRANGTGPFRLQSRVAEVKTVLLPNRDWWDTPQHNLDEAIFLPIPGANARIKALAAGDIDMIYAVPPQSTDRIARLAGLRIVQGPELRTIFLGFDQSRDELLASNVKGRNPFKDRSVRQAFYQAIDEETIRAKVMRGFATPSGLMVAPGIIGFDSTLDTRLPYDPNAARMLLAKAGYPQGFELDMDCPNDRYVNDEAICQAVVAMLARIGVKVKLLAETRAKFFAKLMAPDFRTSFYLLGWTPANDDALDMLASLAASRDPALHQGQANFGGYSNPQLDEIVARIEAETAGEERLQLLRSALAIVKQDIAYIPLHQQQLVWAVRSNVELAQLADGSFPLRYVRLK